MGSTVLLAGVLLAAGAALEPIRLPDGEGGVGFDDLRFSPELHRVLVPPGRSGRLDLIDPRTSEVEAIGGFSSSRLGARGHSQGTTSADSGEGLLFATDRTRGTLNVIDPATKQNVAQARLHDGPDYVRWVEPLHEIWVSEPGGKAIEVFRLEVRPAPKLTQAGLIRVPDGPESLEIDPVRRRAYTNTWHDATLAIDLDSHAIVARWANGCEGARGLTLDVEHGLAFVGCEEGRAVALDVAHDGRVLGSAQAGKGVDVIAFGGKPSHLYVPAADSANLTVVGVGARGDLAVLGTVATAPDAHCVTADDEGRVYIAIRGRGACWCSTTPSQHRDDETAMVDAEPHLSASTTARANGRSRSTARGSRTSSTMRPSRRTVTLEIGLRLLPSLDGTTAGAAGGAAAAGVVGADAACVGV